MLYRNFKAIEGGVQVVWSGHGVKHPNCWRPSDLDWRKKFSRISFRSDDAWYLVRINDTWYRSQDCSAQLIAATLTWGRQSGLDCQQQIERPIKRIFSSKAISINFDTSDVFSKCPPKGGKSLTMATPVLLFNCVNCDAECCCWSCWYKTSLTNGSRTGQSIRSASCRGSLCCRHGGSSPRNRDRGSPTAASWG